MQFLIKVTEANNYLTSALARAATDLGLTVDNKSVSRKGKPSFSVADSFQPHIVSVGTSKHWDLARNSNPAYYDTKYPNLDRYILSKDWETIYNLLLKFKDFKYPPAPATPCADLLAAANARIAELETQLATAQITTDSSALRTFVFSEVARIKNMKKGIGNYVVVKTDDIYSTVHVDKAPSIHEGNLKSLFENL